MDSRSYIVVLQKEKFIVSISSHKEELIIECIEVNNNISKKDIWAYSIDKLWPFKIFLK